MQLDRMKVLVVDDEPAVREVLSLRIEAWGPEVLVAADVEEAERIIAEHEPDIIISDIVLPDASGIELLSRLMRQDPERPVILMTAHGTVDLAVEAMKQGARDFLSKPLDYAKLQSLLLAAAAELERKDGIRALESRLERGAGLGLLVGQSRPMRELYRLIELLATSEASAIITGESGTGKEVVARTIHELSRRRDGPFVAINAAAIPEGLIESELFGHEQGAFTGAIHSRPGCFELANDGTLFLDEIGEMPLSLQPKLLRILEDGHVRRLGGKKEIRVDVRVLAATNRNPLEAIREGRLREDLYYRLNVFELVVPPLRERTGDIPLLAQHFVRLANRKHGTAVDGLSEEAQAQLEAYAWPGNVRELRNVIERAVIVARRGWIETSHLPPYLRSNTAGTEATIVLPVGITAAEAERRLILKTLELVGNNKAEAARRLGMDVKTLRNRLKTYAIEEPEA
ncbi:MAG TPA: sigma-54 dependent transcriptional regulator [Longimicrobiales bacterium]